MSDAAAGSFSESVHIEIEGHPSTLERFVRSLTVEVEDLTDERSRSHLERAGHTLCLRIEARDRIALRAAMNTWLGLLEAAEMTHDAIDRQV